jgi:hypothetical protein
MTVETMSKRGTGNLSLYAQYKITKRIREVMRLTTILRLRICDENLINSCLSPAILSSGINLPQISVRPRSISEVVMTTTEINSAY